MEHSEQPVQIVRRFNRAYTRHLGLLDARHLGTEFGLTETRVLYELAHRRQLTATTIAQELKLDPGYLSRILRSFERRGLVRRTTSVEDRRRSTLALTPRGRATFRRLDALATAHVGRMLEALPGPRQAELVRALDQVHRMLEPGRRERDPGSSFAPSAPATWDGSSSGTVPSTRRSTAGTSASKPWWPASSPTSAGPTTPRARPAGSPNGTAPASAR